MKIKSVRKMMESSFHAVSNSSFHRSMPIDHVELGSDSEDEFGGDGGGSSDHERSSNSESSFAFRFEQEEEPMPMPLEKEAFVLTRQITPNMKVEDCSKSSSQNLPSPTSVIDEAGPLVRPQSIGTLFVDNNNDYDNGKEPQGSSDQTGKENSTRSEPESDISLKKTPLSSSPGSSRRKAGRSTRKSGSLKGPCMEEVLQPKPGRTRRMGRKSKSMRNLIISSTDGDQQSKQEGLPTMATLSPPPTSSRSGRKRGDGMKAKSKSLRSLKCLSSCSNPAEANTNNHSTHAHSGGGSQQLHPKPVSRQNRPGLMRKAQSMRSLVDTSCDSDDDERKPTPGLHRSSSLTGPPPPPPPSKNAMPKFRRGMSLSTNEHINIIKKDEDNGIDATTSTSGVASSGITSSKKREGLMRKSKSVRGMKCSNLDADDVPIESSSTQKKKSRGRAVAMKKANSMRALTVTDEDSLPTSRTESCTTLGERKSSDPVPREKSDREKKPTASLITSSNHSSRRTARGGRRKDYYRSKSMSMVISCDVDGIDSILAAQGNTEKPRPGSTTAVGEDSSAVSSSVEESAPSNVGSGKGKQGKSRFSRVGKASKDGNADHQDSTERRGSPNSRGKPEGKKATLPVRNMPSSLVSHLAEDDGSRKETDVVLQKSNTDPNIRQRKSPACATRRGGKSGRKSFSSTSGGNTSNSSNHRSLHGLKDIRNRFGQSPHASQMIPSHQGSNQSVTSNSCSGSISSLSMSSRLLTQDDFSISSSQRSPFRRAFSSPRLFADASIAEDDETETSSGDLEEHPTTCRWGALPTRNSSNTDTLPVAPDHDLSSVGEASLTLFESRQSSQARWSTEARSGKGSIRRLLESDSRPVQPNHDTSSYCGSAVQPWYGSDFHIPGTPSYSVASSYAGMISELTPGTCMGDSSRGEHVPTKSQSSLQAKFQRAEEKRNFGSFKSGLSDFLLHEDQIHLAVGSDGSANKKKDGAPRMVRRHSFDSVSHSSLGYNDQGIIPQQALGSESENDNAPKIPSRRTSMGSTVYPSDNQVMASSGVSVSVTIPEE